MVETPIYLRRDLAPGCRLDGPCVIAEDDTSTVVPAGFCARGGRPRPSAPAERGRGAMSSAREEHPPAGDVEPADRGGRGAGAGAAAHGVRRGGARGGRPFGRGLRPGRPHAGAGGHRHARATSTPWRPRCAISSTVSRSATMADGDVYVTNDPWMGTGHLFDFVVVSPGVQGRPRGRAASPRPAI